ncbi:MAG TPA: hypothetical protein VEY09_12845 [Pyrinomonadaceae bacterium]|nr:hypothetical protein [Pyrinomonadaceae bacterium]
MNPPPEKRLESVVFFTDRTLGADKVPTALRAAGLNVEVHRDHFAHDVTDPVWIARCAREGWVVLGNDKRIKKNPIEREAIIRGGVAAFFLTAGWRTGEQDADAIIKALKRIANLLMSEPRPFIARIHPDGSVELWVNHKNVDVLKEKEARRAERRRAKRKSAKK